VAENARRTTPAENPFAVTYAMLFRRRAKGNGNISNRKPRFGMLGPAMNVGRLLIRKAPI
jgi:hypothetical protein